MRAPLISRRAYDDVVRLLDDERARSAMLLERLLSREAPAPPVFAQEPDAPLDDAILGVIADIAGLGDQPRRQLLLKYAYGQVAIGTPTKDIVTSIREGR